MEYFDNGATNRGGSGEPVFENTFAGSRKTKNLLTENDLRKLADSFITPDIAEQTGLYRVDSITGAEIVVRKATAHDDYSGIVRITHEDEHRFRTNLNPHFAPR